MYEFICICGAVNKVPTTTGYCWSCKRGYELNWRAEYVATKDTRVVEVDR